jgi:hypothetical protein
MAKNRILLLIVLGLFICTGSVSADQPVDTVLPGDGMPAVDIIIPLDYRPPVASSNQKDEGIVPMTDGHTGLVPSVLLLNEGNGTLSQKLRSVHMYETPLNAPALNDTQRHGISDIPPRMQSGAPGDQNGFGMITALDRILLSLSSMLIILVLVTFAGTRIGRSYRYESGEKTRRWISIVHLLSSLLTMIPILVIITTQYRDGFDDYIISTMYAMIGVQTYLFFSSLIQAFSLWKNIPVPPVSHIHILFVFIAISLILMGRIPFFPPMPNTILAISIIYLPGAVLSLFTAQITKGIHFTGRDPSATLTHSQYEVMREISTTFPPSLLTRYRDIRVIGSGGVAIVYRATRIRDDMEVAVKIPFSPDETSGKTFLNEMAIWRDLHHPAIIEVYDQNIFPVPYVEMEYIRRSLRDLTYPVAPSVAVSIISDIGSALHYAHGKGVIHRDIKPGNVLITDNGRAKLTDWGLSRLLSLSQETKNTSFSLYYATPEQLAPDLYGRGDQRTDIYQLGILLYELLCGQPPYVKTGIGEIFIAIQKNQYPFPSGIDPSLAGFDEIIQRSLKADPNERFRSIEEFLTILKMIERY